MYHLFFINEKSLRRNTKKCAEKIRNVCARNGLPHEIIVTKSIFELEDNVVKYEPYKDTVYYAVGGDGTFQVLANVVNLETAVLQYLPYGSGNNAYITFYGGDFDLERAILSTDVFKADLGQANGEYFITMFGLALDAEIGYNLAKFKWLPVPGKAKYYASILFSLLFRSKPVKVKMTVDGVGEERLSSFVSVTNGPTTGGNTPISPGSSAFDGKLNALVAGSLTFSQAIELFSKVKTGEHLTDPRVSQYLFEELTVESDRKILYEIDGEIRFSDSIKIRACRNAITLKGGERGRSP